MAMKECLNCGEKVDVAIFQCPNCGGSNFISQGGDAASMLEAMQKRNSAAKLNNNCGRYYMAGDYAKAEQELKKALDVDPDYALTHSNMGLVLHAQGRLEEAVSWLEKAHALDPTIDGLEQGLATYRAELAAQQGSGPTQAAAGAAAPVGTDTPAAAHIEPDQEKPDLFGDVCQTCGQKLPGGMGTVIIDGVPHELFVCDGCVVRQEAARKQMPVQPLGVGAVIALVVHMIFGWPFFLYVAIGLGALTLYYLQSWLLVELPFRAKNYQKALSHTDSTKARSRTAALSMWAGSEKWYILKALKPSSWGDDLARSNWVRKAKTDSNVIGAFKYILLTSCPAPDGSHLTLEDGDRQRIHILNALARIALEHKNETALSVLNAVAETEADTVLQPLAARYVSELNEKGTISGLGDSRPRTVGKTPTTSPGTRSTAGKLGPHGHIYVAFGIRTTELSMLDRNNIRLSTIANWRQHIQQTFPDLYARVQAGDVPVIARDWYIKYEASRTLSLPFVIQPTDPTDPMSAANNPLLSSAAETTIEGGMETAMANPELRMVVLNDLAMWIHLRHPDQFADNVKVAEYIIERGDRIWGEDGDVVRNDGVRFAYSVQIAHIG